MNSKHLLTKIFTLLYQEGKQDTPSELSKDICSRIIETIKVPEVTSGLDTEHNVLGNLTRTIKRIIKTLGTEPLSPAQLKQQFIIDCGDDTSTRDALEAGFVEGLENEDRQLLINSIRGELRQFAREEDMRRIVKETHTKLAYSSEEIENIRDYVQEMISKLESYVQVDKADDPAVVVAFKFDEVDVMESVFKEIRKRAEGSSGYLLGWKHVNKMTGGRLEPGKLVSVAAQQSQHKTGTTLAMFRHLLMYNMPHDVKYVEDIGKTEEELEAEEKAYVYSEEEWVLYQDPFVNRPIPVIALKDPFKGKTPIRKPLAIRVSAEDEMADNMQKLFQDTYFNIEGKPVDMSEFDEAQMSAYMRKHLERNGWEVQVMRINPSEWTYRNVIQQVLDAEADGYEVKVYVLDYLSMIPTRGCEQGPAGHDLRDLFRRIRNFMSARNILFITPHQLSPDATRLLRLGAEDIVKKYPNGNYYAGSTQIAQEMDLEIFLHIEVLNGVKWLTIQRGKYRSPKAGEIPQQHTYCALPFDPKGGLKDDLLLAVPVGRAEIGNTITENNEEEALPWLM